MKGSKTFMQWLREEEKGQTTIEYVLVVILIALVLVFAFQGPAENAVQNAANKIATEIENAGT
jgi:Flp pilus assembly pilin Flp